MVHDGLFVVRVVVAVDERTLAAGLGANGTLELAEDIACTRALERLALAGVVVSAPAAKPTLAKAEKDVGDRDDRPSPLPQPVPPGKQAHPTTDLPSPAQLVGLPSSPPAAEDLAPDSTSLGEVDHSPGAWPKPETKAPQPALESPVLPDPIAAEKEISAPADPPPRDPPGPVTPVDLSDIIAQTDVELQRLGWGVHQGREFLEHTYGKRSRHDLTDEELLAFLLYLETQPSPTSA